MLETRVHMACLVGMHLKLAQTIPNWMGRSLRLQAFRIQCQARLHDWDGTGKQQVEMRGDLHRFRTELSKYRV